MIRHIVLCKVKAEADSTEVAAVWEGLAALVGVVPGLLGSHFGADVSPEGIARGYTHGFTMDFEDMAALEGYLVHPAHVKAGARLVGICEGGVEGVLVVDF
ncbi:MAG: Dabb family protein [Pseudomonadota bacterium]